jgi:DNA-binding XRE family transcriptional regulator
MPTPTLRAEIERARKRLGLSKKGYGKQVGISMQALHKIYRGGGITGETLALLQSNGDLRITKKLIASLAKRPAVVAVSLDTTV